MKHWIRKTLNVLSTTLIVVVGILAFLLVGLKLFGLTPYTVLSGSMEPAYHVGSVIYVVKVDPEELAVGDPVTFLLEGTTVTHRIIEKGTNEKGLYFVTQGDANNTSDPPIYPSNIIGKPVFSIPHLGRLSVYIQNPPGTFVAIGICALVAILTFLPELFPVEPASKAADGSEDEDSDVSSVV